MRASPVAQSSNRLLAKEASLANVPRKNSQAPCVSRGQPPKSEHRHGFVQRRYAWQGNLGMTCKLAGPMHSAMTGLQVDIEPLVWRLTAS